MAALSFIQAILYFIVYGFIWLFRDVLCVKKSRPCFVCDNKYREYYYHDKIEVKKIAIELGIDINKNTVYSNKLDNLYDLKIPNLGFKSHINSFNQIPLSLVAKLNKCHTSSIIMQLIETEFVSRNCRTIHPQAKQEFLNGLYRNFYFSVECSEDEINKILETNNFFIQSQKEVFNKIKS